LYKKALAVIIISHFICASTIARLFLTLNSRCGLLLPAVLILSICQINLIFSNISMLLSIYDLDLRNIAQDTIG